MYVYRSITGPLLGLFWVWKTTRSIVCRKGALLVGVTFVHLIGRSSLYKMSIVLLHCFPRLLWVCEIGQFVVHLTHIQRNKKPRHAIISSNRSSNLHDLSLHK
jgi:hypothetical protein